MQLPACHRNRVYNVSFETCVHMSDEDRIASKTSACLPLRAFLLPLIPQKHKSQKLLPQLIKWISSSSNLFKVTTFSFLLSAVGATEPNGGPRPNSRPFSSPRSFWLRFPGIFAVQTAFSPLWKNRAKMASPVPKLHAVLKLLLLCSSYFGLLFRMQRRSFPPI